MSDTTGHIDVMSLLAAVSKLKDVWMQMRRRTEKDGNEYPDHFSEEVCDILNTIRRWADDMESAMAEVEAAREVINIMAVYKALGKIAHYCDRKDSMNAPYCADGYILSYIAKQALSVPPRNCDRFATYTEAVEYFNKHNQPIRNSLKSCRIDGNDYSTMSEWLFASSKKGNEEAI